MQMPPPLRRADVFNRGFGGYTSSLGLAIMDGLLPPALSPTAADTESLPTLVTIFFGANDATAPTYYMVTLCQ